MERSIKTLNHPRTMPLDTDSIRFAQSAMKGARLYDGPIDGVINDAMVAATARIAGIKKSWPREPKVVAYFQIRAGLK